MPPEPSVTSTCEGPRSCTLRYCYHHVVDTREVTEEPIESNRICGVEGRGTQGINLTGSALEALGIPAREVNLGPFRTCTTCRFESDASATADHDHGLPKELWFTVDGRGSHSAHCSSDSTSILLATLSAVRKRRARLPQPFTRSSCS